MISLVIFVLIATLALSVSTPLDDYVWSEDSQFSWVDTGTTFEGHSVDKSNHWTGYVLNMTSQQWLTPADVTGSIWWHYLVVIVPDNVNYKRNATLYITGGDNGGGLPDPGGEDIVLASALAMGTGTITTALFQIPNQCVTFTSDPLQKCRSEDSIIAFTWDHYLKDPSDPTWLVRLPMVKASVRAMDVTTAFVARKFSSSGFNLDSFIVSGASKRGWTTWLVGAVDPVRVKAIIPIVLDAINFVAVEHHQWRSYGGWSFALQDYYDLNITARFDDPNMKKLCEVEDPYFYASRLTMPKLIVNAVGDEFQMPDDTHYWWSEMPEPKRFLMVPRAEHSMLTGILEVVPVIGTWIAYLLQNKPVPEISWSISGETGEITATLTGGEPETVYMWHSTTCNSVRRDFRVVSIDNPCECGIGPAGIIAGKVGYCPNKEVLWHKTELSPVSADGTVYKAAVSADQNGKWSAFFIDVTYKATNNHSGLQAWPYTPPGSLEFTTEVSVWPNTFPYPDCHGAECYGTLL